MRKSLLLVALLATLPISAVADDCGDVSSYSVRKINFKKFDVKEAVSAVLQDTPFKADFTRAETGKSSIDANGVKGRLDAVLDNLTGKSGLTYKKIGCDLVFSTRSNVISREETTEWVLRAGQPIDEELRAWAKRADWPLEWKVQASWRVPATVKFSGTLEESITAAIRSMYQDGKPIKLKIYDNYMEVVDYVPQ